MKGKKYLVIFVLFVLLSFQISATSFSDSPYGETEDQDPWDNPSELTTAQLMEDPNRAKSVWNQLNADQKDELFKENLRFFQEEFFSEKGFSGNLENGNVEYDGTFISNRGTKIKVDALSGLEIYSLPDGGFIINGRTGVSGDGELVEIAEDGSVLSFQGDFLVIGANQINDIEIEGNSFTINGNRIEDANQVSYTKKNGHEVYYVDSDVENFYISPGEDGFSFSNGILTTYKDSKVIWGESEYTSLILGETTFEKRGGGDLIIGSLIHEFKDSDKDLFFSVTQTAPEKVTICIKCDEDFTSIPGNAILWDGDILTGKDKASVVITDLEEGSSRVTRLSGNVEGITFKTDGRGYSDLISDLTVDQVKQLKRNEINERISKLQERINEIAPIPENQRTPQEQAIFSSHTKSINGLNSILERGMEHEFNKVNLLDVEISEQNHLYKTSYVQNVKGDPVGLDVHKISLFNRDDLDYHDPFYFRNNGDNIAKYENNKFTNNKGNTINFQSDILIERHQSNNRDEIILTGDIGVMTQELVGLNIDIMEMGSTIANLLVISSDFTGNVELGKISFDLNEEGNPNKISITSNIGDEKFSLLFGTRTVKRNLFREAIADKMKLSVSTGSADGIIDTLSPHLKSLGMNELADSLSELQLEIPFDDLNRLNRVNGFSFEVERNGDANIIIMDARGGRNNVRIGATGIDTQTESHGNLLDYVYQKHSEIADAETFREITDIIRNEAQSIYGIN